MSNRLYVGRLTGRVRESDVERLYSKFGRIRGVMMKTGYAFVEFEDPRDAEDACYETNGRDLLGDRILVEMARGTPHGRDRIGWGFDPPPRSSRRTERSDYRIVVENLSSRVDHRDLKDMMRKSGEVVYCETNEKKREGYVEFGSKKDMRYAIDDFDGKEIKGRKVSVYEDRPKKRSRTRSRSGSRKRDNSRSPERQPEENGRGGSQSPSGSPSTKRPRNDSGADGNRYSRSPTP